MSAKFLKVMALSKRPSDFKHEADVRPAAGTGPSEGTAPHDLPDGTIEDTAPLEATEPSLASSASKLSRPTKVPEVSEGTVLPESHASDAIGLVNKDAEVPKAPDPLKRPEASRGTDPLQAIQPTVAYVPRVLSRPVGALRIYRCLRAQDGHSFAEDRLYTALWNSELARIETPDSKLITIGWDRMSQIAGMTPRNARENCFRLVEKLAFERVQRHVSEERMGTTYRIYSLEEILRRRLAAGLEWVVRNRGGVTFVPPPPQGTVSSKSTVSIGIKGTVVLQESVSAKDVGEPANVARTCRQSAAEILETWLREAREITAQAGSSEKDRAWAREILAAYGEGKR